jgi:hypothetical protein
MIRNANMIKEFEARFMREEGRLTYEESLRLFTYMWNEGVRFGILPLKEPLEGIEVDIRIAKVLRSCSKNSCPG